MITQKSRRTKNPAMNVVNVPEITNTITYSRRQTDRKMEETVTKKPCERSEAS